MPNMPESPELVEKLKAADHDIQEYASALKAINAKQHKRIFHLEAENVSLENRIAAIKEGNADPELEKLSSDEIVRRLFVAADQLGYSLVKKESQIAL
jgi:hypothetical protein